MGVLDLHTHSSLSDGSDPPEQIANLAAKAGLAAVALTDHDRLDGIPAARARAEAFGLRVVAGVEVSGRAPMGSCHLLVYFVEPGEGPLQDELGRLLDDRARRNRLMLDQLRRLGIPISDEELAAQAGGDGKGAGRPHVAALLVAKGVVGSIPEAFEEWLGDGKPGFVPKDRLSPAEIVSLARRSGGVVSLAHPISLDLEPSQLESAVRELAAGGLAGLESYYGRYLPEERAALVDLALRCGLVPTGGSDYHGDYKPDLALGTGTGDLVVPDQVLAALEDHRP